MKLPISIVTPNLNTGLYLRDCLESVRREGPDEYLVVDGGSTDGSDELYREYPQVITHLIQEPDQGLYDALTKGLNTSTGEILGYLNADDFYLPGALATVREIFETHPQVQWLTSLYPVSCREDGTLTHCRRASAFFGHWHRRGLYLPPSGIGTASYLPQEATFWRRSLWESFDGFAPGTQLAGDWQFWNHCFSQTPLYHLEAPLAVFRSRPGQLSQSGAEAYLREARAGCAPAGPVRRTAARCSLALRMARRHYPRIKFNPDANAWLVTCP